MFFSKLLGDSDISQGRAHWFMAELLWFRGSAQLRQHSLSGGGVADQNGVGSGNTFGQASQNYSLAAGMTLRCGSQSWRDVLSTHPLGSRLSQLKTYRSLELRVRHGFYTKVKLWLKIITWVITFTETNAIVVFIEHCVKHLHKDRYKPFNLSQKSLQVNCMSSLRMSKPKLRELKWII